LTVTFNGIFTLTVAAGNQNRLSHSRIMDEREHKVVMQVSNVELGEQWGNSQSD
jgi:hypothetical protein